MIPALPFVLLFLLCPPILSGDSLRIGPDGEGVSMKEEEIVSDSCQCTRSQRVGAWIHVTNILNRIWMPQGAFERISCSCSHGLSLHRQPVEFDKSSPVYLSPRAHRLPNTFERTLLASPVESMNHCQMWSRHDLPHSVASPPCGGHAVVSLFSARAPTTEVAIPTASLSPEPSSHAPQSRQHYGQGQAKSWEPSAAPAPGPTSASPPAYRHPTISISPAPDCGAVVCSPPRVKAPFASQCSCVQPIEVKLQLSVPLYALFPFISVLAEELAEGATLSSSQVQIVGANASGQNDDFSVIDANLLPLGEDFNIVTARSISQKFWNHEIEINGTLFGNYTVVQVNYPGLPAPPPATGVGGIEKPFGVNISNPKPSKKKFGTSTIVAIVLSASVSMVLCSGAVWLMLLKYRRVGKAAISMPTLGFTKSKIGGGCLLSSDRGSFASISLPSSAMTCASTARLFNIAELNRATNEFAPGNILGEGGFGRVFCGVLDDGTDVAVKVLTRENHQGGKEFITEVEILSRLHHRNLVKLIGICTEEHARCLVYELVPNGSVESHLHGKGTCALDWETRMKVVLGAARGLAYLHEDSSPPIIHRDFKSANILLDSDFNPKVSDFGLAKVAPDSGKEHLSTKVMGTFGYVAPEYAMTGHLLVKSDVYSYGVVLLEVLSRRKPVDMSQPPGQENLVTWARPLLTTMEGLRVLLDPSLRDSVSYDSLAKVAAIASMCVHPEVSDRPSMGEVVQALKLVCNEFDVEKMINSSKCTQDGDCSVDIDLQTGQHNLGRNVIEDDASSMSISYDSGPSQEELQRPFSPSALFSDSMSYMGSSKFL